MLNYISETMQAHCPKRLLLILLPVLIIGGLTACGGGGSSETKSAAKPDRPGKGADQVEQETYNSFNSGFHETGKEKSK